MIIALNNKSNLNKEEFLKYQEKLSELEFNSKVIVCPTYLNVNLYNLKKISLGSQNVSSHTKGAYTGEVSAEDLKVSNVEYCIVGHSERREYQKENLAEINEKIKRLFENDIIPILCIGETKEERDTNQVERVLEEEIKTAVEGITQEQQEKLIIAYEPIWSIGTGVIPTIEQIEDVFKFIKKYLPNTIILYGGSANEKNVDQLKQCSLIEGYLLGGLSLKPNSLQIFLNKLDE